LCVGDLIFEAFKTPPQNSVVYHPNTSRLAGIGMVLALVGWYIWLVFFSTVRFGGNSFLNFLGTLFLKKSMGNPFSLKRGAECSKRGLKPPFLEGIRGSRQNFDTNQDFLWYQYGKYWKITNQYQPKIPNQ
jgi:hypothetical protein